MSLRIVIINLHTVIYAITVKLARNVTIAISWIVRMMDVLAIARYMIQINHIYGKTNKM